MKILLGAAAAALIIAPVEAFAVDLDFTFTNASDGVVVKGVIDGLTPGATSAASSVSITGYTDISVDDPYEFSTPFEMTSITTNSFTLDPSGSLTAADFTGQGFFGAFSSEVDLSLFRGPGSDVAGVFQNLSSGSGPFVQSGGDFGKLDFAVVTQASGAPEPAMWIVMLVGFASIGAIGSRRVSRAPG
jgi:hypothetical protein